MKWFEATEITQWADKHPREAQQKLPELVRRLIHATAPSIQRIDFPCDGSVGIGGWDGHLETVSQSPFYPDGLSKWELGTEKSPGVKADSDYASRKKDPRGANPKEVTYVAVTTRSWPQRDKWEQAKRKEKFWKSVRAVGVTELEQWLASAPAAALWFAGILGKQTGGIRALEVMWEEWSMSTNPVFTPDVVISGRTEDRDAVHRWLSQGSGVFQLQGDSSDEPLAFLYSSIATLPDDLERERHLARAVVVDNIQEFRQCYEMYSNLIIAAPSECIEAAHRAAQKGHHVFITRDAKTIAMGEITSLARPKRAAMQDALKAAGLDEAEARRRMRDSGGSIPVLRRRSFRAGLNKVPAWAEAPTAQALLPVLIAGAWVEGKSGDKELLEALSGESYQDFIRKITPFISMEDAPIQKVGNVWMLKSPLDAWFLIGRHLDSEYFERFRKAVNSVLTQTDPKYDLPPKDRWAAAIYGKSPNHSEWIRRGLIESLTILGVFGEGVSKAVDRPEEFVASVVRNILEGANTWEAWASLKDIMALIAEASPESFIEVLEEKLDENKTPFEDLMRDDEDRYGLGDCKHSGLLWAIEGMAWDPQYLLDSVRLFLKLSQIDSGSRWSNRPLASLTDILLPGIPQTNASPEERLAAYDYVIENDPVIAWKIGIRHIDGGTISTSHMFRWRDRGGDRVGLEGELQNNYTKYVNGLLPRWEKLVAATNENISSAVQEFLRLPEDVRTKLLKALETLDPSSFSKEERDALLHNFRHIINWISNYGEEKHKTHLPALTKAYELLTPDDLIEKYNWLFTDGWPQLPEAEPQASKGHQERLSEIRAGVAREMLDNLSLEDVLKYGESLNYQAMFFGSLALAVKDKEEDEKLVDALTKRLVDNSWPLIGYSMGRVEVKEISWVPMQIERLKKLGDVSPKVVAALFKGIPESTTIWESVEKHGSDVEKEYWKIATGYTRSETEKSSEIEIAVSKLLEVERPEAALNLAGSPHISLPSKLLERLLLSLLNSKNESKKHLDGTMLEFHLTNVFNQLYEREELSIEEIGKLEWPFAQVFDRYNRHNTGPLALHKSLQKDPSFFVELISHLYKKDDGSEFVPEGITEDQASNIASNAREVLESWYLVPGVKEDQTVDKVALNKWVDEARKLSESKGYLRGCDLKLAEVFSRFPSDSDGMWPHIALRETIERIKAPLFEEHIPYALYNSRGVRTRSVNSGGEEERKIALDYFDWAKKMKAKWPRTSKLIKSYANMLDSDAKREDIDRELRDIEYS